MHYIHVAYVLLHSTFPRHRPRRKTRLALRPTHALTAACLTGCSSSFPSKRSVSQRLRLLTAAAPFSSQSALRRRPAVPHRKTKGVQCEQRRHATLVGCGNPRYVSIYIFTLLRDFRSPPGIHAPVACAANPAFKSVMESDLVRHVGGSTSFVSSRDLKIATRPYLQRRPSSYSISSDA